MSFCVSGLAPPVLSLSQFMVHQMDVPERKGFALLFDEVVEHLVYAVWIIFPEQNFRVAFHQFLVYYCVMFDGAVFSFAEETPVVGFRVFAAVFFEVGDVGGQGGCCVAVFRWRLVW